MNFLFNNILYGITTCAVSLYCNPYVFKLRNVSINNCSIWVLMSNNTVCKWQNYDQIRTVVAIDLDVVDFNLSVGVQSCIFETILLSTVFKLCYLNCEFGLCCNHLG